MSVQVMQARSDTRAHRMREVAALLEEHGWEGGGYRESGNLRVWVTGHWPHNDRGVLLYDDGTAWLYDRGKEEGPHSIHRERGWRAVQEFVKEADEEKGERAALDTEARALTH